MNKEEENVELGFLTVTRGFFKEYFYVIILFCLAFAALYDRDILRFKDAYNIFGFSLDRSNLLFCLLILILPFVCFEQHRRKVISKVDFKKDFESFMRANGETPRSLPWLLRRLCMTISEIREILKGDSRYEYITDPNNKDHIGLRMKSEYLKEKESED